MQSAKLIEYLNTLLDIPEHPDFSGAHNGVQIEPPQTIRTVATAVDACLPVAEAASAADADLLIVHHGLLWSGVRPLVGSYFAQIAGLIRGNCGLYSAHLPLDGHETFGNNAILAEKLGLATPEPFGDFKGAVIGRIGSIDCNSVDVATQRLGMAVHEAVAPQTPVRRLAVVSGSAGSMLVDAHNAGAHVLLTGEANHHDRVTARDLGIGLWLGGHYASETVGVRALGEHLAEKFGLVHHFIDLPTGG